MEEKSNDTALIRVSFKVPRKVRETLAAGAKDTGVSLPVHVRNQLSPIVPSLLCVLAGYAEAA